MLAFSAHRLGSMARYGARGVATRPFGSSGLPSLLRQHAKPAAFAGLACAASFAAADTCMRYRRGNEAAFSEWNQVLDPPEKERRTAVEGAYMLSGRAWPSKEQSLQARRAHAEGQVQRGEPVTDSWTVDPMVQRTVLFGVPFVLVNVGLILVGLCSRKPHLMVGRTTVGTSIASYGRSYDRQARSVIGDVLFTAMYTGALFPFGTMLPPWSVLAWMPVEQLAAVLGSTAAVVTVAMNALKVRPLPVFGYTLGACGITAAMFSHILAGICFAALSVDGKLLADILTGANGAGLLEKVLGILQLVPTFVAVCMAGCAIHELKRGFITAAAAEAKGCKLPCCRVANVARGAGFFTGYGLYKLGFTGHDGYGIYKFELAEEQ